MIAGAFLGCSVVLFCLSFPNFLFLEGAPFLAWGCAFPLFLALDGRGLRERWLLGLAWGVAAHGLLTAWIFPVSIGGWCVFTLALALQGVVFAVLFPVHGISATAKLFYIPSIWIIAEWVRAFVLGGFAWSLGYSQAPLPELIQVASFGGVYAVAWVVVFVNAAVYLVLCARGQRKRYGMLAAALFTVIFAAGAVRLMGASHDGGHTRVAAIQPNILRDDKTRDELYDANIMRHMALTKKAAAAGQMTPSDLVVWPETAITDDILTDLRWRPRLEAAAKGLGVNLLVGSALLWDGHDLNSALLLSSDGMWRSVYHKMRLVPFAEFTPSRAQRIAQLLGIGRYQFTAGTRPGAMAMADGKGLGVVICSEEFYPDLFQRLAASRPAFAVVMLNDGWFTRREALFLHALAAPLRAVESGLPVIRAANTGRTCAFDAYGRGIGRSLDVQRPNIVVYDVPPATATPFYAKFGDIFTLICSGFVIIIMILAQVRRPRTEFFHGV